MRIPSCRRAVIPMLDGTTKQLFGVAQLHSSKCILFTISIVVFLLLLYGDPDARPKAVDEPGFGSSCKGHTGFCRFEPNCSRWNGREFLAEYSECIPFFTSKLSQFSTENQRVIDRSPLTTAINKTLTAIHNVRDSSYMKWASQHSKAPLKSCHAEMTSSWKFSKPWISKIVAVESFDLPGDVSVMKTTYARNSKNQSRIVTLPVTVLIIDHYSDDNIAHQFLNSGLFFAANQLKSTTFLNRSDVYIYFTNTNSKSSSSHHHHHRLESIFRGTKQQENANLPINKAQRWAEMVVSTMLPVIDITKSNPGLPPLFPHTDVVVPAIYKVAITREQLIYYPLCYWVGLQPVPEVIMLRNQIRQGLGALAHLNGVAENLNNTKDNQRFVLVLYRSPRFLVDFQHGTFQSIIDSLSALNLPLRVTSFSTLAPLEQAWLVSNAAVVISVHGADLTNILFLPPSSAVIEISLRYGWCCDPAMHPPSKCTGPCKPYHKADFANLAQALGHEYHFIDPVYSDPPVGKNPINTANVYINSTELAMLTLLLWGRTVYSNTS